MPTPNNLDVALKIQADAAQARAQLQGVQSDLKGVENAATGAGRGANSYTAQMSRLNDANQATARQVQNTAAALRLMAQIDPVGTKLDKLDELESELKKLHAAGEIGADDFNALGAILAAQRTKLTDTATASKEVAAGLNLMALSSGQAAREYGVLVGEMARGNYSRAEGSLITLSNRIGLMPKLLSPVGLAFIGIAAAVATLGEAYVKGAQESEEFSKALISTGDYAGVTNTQLHDMARTLSGTTIGQAKDALLALASTGQFTGEQLQRAGQAAVDMAVVTGQNVGAAVRVLTSLRDDPVDAIQKLNEQFHFLDAATFQQIRRLQDLGQTQQAADLAEQTYADNLRDRAGQVEANLGAVQRYWEAVKQAASDAWDVMEGIGRKPIGDLAGLQSDYDSLLKRRMALEDYKNGGIAGAGLFGAINDPHLFGMNGAEAQKEIDSIDHSLSLLRGQMGKLQDQAKDTSIAEQLNADGIAASKWADSAIKGFDKMSDRAAAAAKVTAKLHAIVAANGTLPEGVQEIGQKFYGPGFDYLVNKEAGISTSGVPGAQRNAALAAAQAAMKQIDDIYANGQKVIDAQHKSALVNDQAYYDAERGMLTEWENDKVAALEQEKQAAQSHVVTQADRIKADQKVAEIDSEIAKVHADAAAKRMDLDAEEKQAVEQSQKAWESLRRSMETPINAKIDAAIDKIQKLNKMLAAGAGNPAQYHQLLQQVGENALSPLPTYRGVGAAVGGPFGELQKNFAAQQALETAYQTERLALKNKFRHDDTAQEEAYQAALAKLDQDYAKKSLVIEQSRQQLFLTGAADFFGQMTALSSSQNRKIAAIGKAAAIAQTVIKTYQSATEAYASLAAIPYVGPELGAAAAAAAIAAGMANVAQIRAQNTNGYEEGGYTGPGAKHQIAGVVHAGEGVLSQGDVAALGGPAAFLAFQRSLRGYADGGFVSPMPADIGFTAPSMPRVQLPSPDANGSANRPQVGVRIVNITDPSQVGDFLASSEGEKIIMNTIARNRMRVKQTIG